MRKSEILPTLAAHGTERAFCALFKEITLFSRFGDDLRTVRRFFRSGGLKSELLPNLLRMA